MPSLILAARSRTPEWHSATWCVGAQADSVPKEGVDIGHHRASSDQPHFEVLCVRIVVATSRGVLFHKLIAVTEIGGTEDSS